MLNPLIEYAHTREKPVGVVTSSGIVLLNTLCHQVTTVIYCNAKLTPVMGLVVKFTMFHHWKIDITITKITLFP